MILEREQIQRYMRHIIMPEIGGIGQKKLLSSAVMLYCDDLSNSALMLYYLAAMGIGNIHCYTENLHEALHITDNIKRLNPDVNLSIDTLNKERSTCNAESSVIILCLEKGFANIPIEFTGIPVVYAAASGDLGYLRTTKDIASFTLSFNEIKDFYTSAEKPNIPSTFGKACSGLLGTLSAIEAVKTLLNIGSPCDHALYFDLSASRFLYGEKLENSTVERGSRRDISAILKKSSALIVGSGGLGSPAAYTLAMMGIGKIGLVDYDVVEISNLNRQILHSTDKIGVAKVRSAEEFIRRLNPEVEICAYQEKFSVENAQELIEGYDVIIDGLDNLPTRYLLNDICYLLKKPLIEAGVLGFNGLAAALLPDQGPCYRCIFPESNAAEGTVPSCSETGVLGAVPGAMGIIEAVEAVKQLAGINSSLVNKILLFDALNLDITILDVFKEPGCPLCGSNPTIQALQKYEFICKTKGY